MNKNNLDIFEIRKICGLSIDYLKNEFIGISSSIKSGMSEVLEDMAKFIDENNTEKHINSDFTNKIAYAFKFVTNIFAMKVLNIDREFLNFETYKKKEPVKKTTVTLKENSEVMRRIRVLDGLVTTLESVRTLINQDESKALLFYDTLNVLAYDKGLFWPALFNSLENIGIKIDYSLEDRKIAFANHTNGTRDYELENKIANIIEENYTKEKGVSR